MLENVRGPITEQVLTYACGKMLPILKDEKANINTVAITLQ